jgi:hypothetical protein
VRKRWERRECLIDKREKRRGRRGKEREKGKRSSVAEEDLLQVW